MFGDDRDEDEDRAPLWRRVGLPVAGVMLAVALAAVGVSMLRHSGPAPRPHDEERITQIMLPPPPPPPPPPKVPPPPKPDEEKPKEEVPTPHKVDVPKPAPMKAPAPPGNPLTAEAGNGPSAYGLGVGNGEGGDCLGNCGGGGGGDAAAYYAGLIKSQIEAALSRDEKLRFAKYRITVSLLMDASGHAVQATVKDFTGDPGLDAEINRVLSSIAANETLPAEVTAQPVLVRITAHARG
jgi:hypothetical protein